MNEGFIHLRHLANLAWRNQLKAYRRAEREWMTALRQRERLLRKYNHLEGLLRRRLSQNPPPPIDPQPAEIVFEIDGVWFSQTRRRTSRSLLTRRPLQASRSGGSAGLRRLGPS